MLPFGIGFSEVLLILVVVLLVVGPQKLPEIARTLGKGVRMARRAGQELRDAIEVDEIRRSVYDNTVRPWQQAPDIEDAEVDDRGTYARAAAKVSAATRAAMDSAEGGVDLTKVGDVAATDAGPPGADGDNTANSRAVEDPDETASSGPIARSGGPIMPVARLERPADDPHGESDEAVAGTGDRPS